MSLRTSHMEGSPTATMAMMQFQMAAKEKVRPTHSEGNPWRSACSLTYHDSRMVNRIGVDAPATAQCL